METVESAVSLQKRSEENVKRCNDINYRPCIVQKYFCGHPQVLVYRCISSISILIFFMDAGLFGFVGATENLLYLDRPVFL